MVLTTDKAHAKSFYSPPNSLIKLDYRNKKRRFTKTTGFKSLCYISCAIKGMETIHALYKQRRSLQIDSAMSTSNDLQQPYL